MKSLTLKNPGRISRTSEFKVNRDEYWLSDWYLPSQQNKAIKHGGNTLYKSDVQLEIGIEDLYL